MIGVDRNESPTFSGHGWITSDVRDVPFILDELQGLNAPVDVLINCAGVGSSAGTLAVTAEELQRVAEINTFAPVLLASALIPAMVERGFGRVVNVSSIHGRAGYPGTIAYDLSKAALDNATRSMAAEFGSAGVLINAVAPGFVRTPLCTDEHLAGAWFTEGYVASGRLPQGRAAEPGEIAELIAWLSSPQNTYVTGQVVYADGGLYSRF